MIGIYDSGLGGLTAFRELRRLCTDEDIIYLGDTARVPYGTRTKETIKEYALQCGKTLEKFRINALLVACGTVSANALSEMKKMFSFPVCGVIEPAVNAAVKATKSGKIAVLATPATVRSGAFADAIKTALPGAEVVSRACPLFVPLVENGMKSDSEMVKLACRQYLTDIAQSEIDTVILGCTHYPIIADAISSFLPGVTLINSGKEAALSILPHLSHCESGKNTFLVTDGAASFSENASVFLNSEIGDDVKQIVL